MPVAQVAIGNALIDALWHLGVRNVSLPITPATAWRALKSVQAKA
jgi:aerobic carbon-monoxide dehydrogenase large subunit